MRKRTRKTTIRKRKARRGRQREVHALAGPVLQFDLGSEIEQMRREEAWQSGRNAKTLVKYPDFRIVLILMKPNTRMIEHKAAGRISIHALAGRVRLHLPDQTVDIPAGSVLALERAVPHDVEALEESAFLLSISWPQGLRD